MKKLITLIFSAVLLCPMWASAQSTTPSVLPSVKWTGNMILTPLLDSYMPQVVPINCGVIQEIHLSITVPNNHSAVHAVHGYFSCNPRYGNLNVLSHLPLTGTVLALTSNGEPASSNSITSSYRLGLHAGLLIFNCSIQASNLEMICTLEPILGQGDSVTGVFGPQR
jgi:hypothetical protein